RELGLSPDDVRLRWNDRSLVEKLFELAHIPPERFSLGYYLLDRIHKMTPEDRKRVYAEKSVPEMEQSFFEKIAAGENPSSPGFWSYGGLGKDEQQKYQRLLVHAAQPYVRMSAIGLGAYMKPEPDPSIVRGLAYYTGFVWEVDDVKGESR